jgi:hypothetical protein
MARVPAMSCPECNFAAPHEDAFHFTRRKRRLAALAASCFLLALGAFIAATVPADAILARLPRPALALALGHAVPPPPTVAGADIPALPAPPAVLRPGRRLWERLSWNEQYVYAVRAWGDLVAADEPTKVLSDLARVHRALEAMDQWDRAAGMTAWVDAWVFTDEIDRQRRRIEELPGRLVTLSPPGGGTLALDRNELLMLAFQRPRNETSGAGLRGGPYIAAPQAYLGAMAASTTDPAAQRYAIQRLGPEPSGTIDLDALFAGIEKNDPDAATRKVATSIRLWRTGLLKASQPPGPPDGPVK